MVKQKEIKKSRGQKVLKGLVISGCIFGVCCMLIIAYLFSAFKVSENKPKWVESDLVQRILNVNEVEAKQTDDLIVPIQPEPKIIYKNPYEQSEDMKILSLYIRSRVRNTPLELADRIAYEVCTQSRDKGIPFEITVGIIETESMWNPRAVSKKDARGLMQALIEDGIEIEKEKLYGIEYNIDIGLRILISKIKKCRGSLSNALYCYVGGDDKYKDSVYAAMGKFLLFKITYVEDS